MSSWPTSGALRTGFKPLAAAPRRAPPRLARRVAASSSSSSQDPPSPPRSPQQQPPSIADSDAVFLAKLAAVSFGLGAAVKYGSLLINLPFQPNAAAALLLVLAPPVVWAASALQKQ